MIEIRLESQIIQAFTDSQFDTFQFTLFMYLRLKVVLSEDLFI